MTQANQPNDPIASKEQPRDLAREDRMLRGDGGGKNAGPQGASQDDLLHGKGGASAGPQNTPMEHLLHGYPDDFQEDEAVNAVEAEVKGDKTQK